MMPEKNGGRWWGLITSGTPVEGGGGEVFTLDAHVRVQLADGSRVLLKRLVVSSGDTETIKRRPVRYVRSGTMVRLPVVIFCKSHWTNY